MHSSWRDTSSECLLIVSSDPINHHRGTVSHDLEPKCMIHGTLLASKPWLPWLIDILMSCLEFETKHKQVAN
jgi:hypothetical protein